MKEPSKGGSFLAQLINQGFWGSCNHRLKDDKNAKKVYGDLRVYKTILL